MSQESVPQKIAVVLLSSLPVWQKLNVTAFTISGVAQAPGAVGKPYVDGSGLSYLPMFKEPVLVYAATAEEMVRTCDRLRSREVAFSIFTEDLFDTFDDEANRAAVAIVETGSLKVMGLAFRTEKKDADKVLKGLKLAS